MRSSGALLAHSDLTLINEDESLIHPSCWEYEGRVPEKTSSELLLMRNTVTGCSMLFCASLLTKVLPFPKQTKIYWHHDHWVALVASNLGSMVHLRNPLLLYRQHSQNSLGVQKDSHKFIGEIQAWFDNKFRITGKSYLVKRDISQAFYTRFLPGKRNPFDLNYLDFGFGICRLGFKCYLSGNSGLGATLRLIVLKNILVLQNCFKQS
jgi:hypothetical protein